MDILASIFVVVALVLFVLLVGFIVAWASRGFSSYRDSEKNIMITGRDDFGYPIRETKKEYRERQESYK